MKIIIELMLYAGDNCGMTIEQIQQLILSQINTALSPHAKDHIHEIRSEKCD